MKELIMDSFGRQIMKEENNGLVRMTIVKYTRPMDIEPEDVSIELIGRDKEGHTIFASVSELIQNALNQEADGIAPCYRWRDEEYSFPKGWLVYNSWDYGCGVVYRRHDGKMILQKGMQGDFIMDLGV